MENKPQRRGYFPNDAQEFGLISLGKLHRAAEDLYWLRNRGYPSKGASVFVGNHFLLSERQRIALVRTVSSRAEIHGRWNKEIRSEDVLENAAVNIDGFNTIISLEVALSGSLILQCMDGTIRDLAGLRGTYHVIDKTSVAVRLILGELKKVKVGKANFYLDAQVSNSGRLKARIAELAEDANMSVGIEVIGDVDKTLKKLSFVITSDAFILDECQSWFNLNSRIIENIPDKWTVGIGPSPS